MKKIILSFLLVFLMASLAFASGPPVKGARELGTFSSGIIYSFTSASGNTVTLDDCGYISLGLCLQVSVSGTDPNFITGQFYLSKTGAYWEWIIRTSSCLETLYMYSEPGNQLDVWIYP